MHSVNAENFIAKTLKLSLHGACWAQCPDGRWEVEPRHHEAREWSNQTPRRAVKAGHCKPSDRRCGCRIDETGKDVRL